MEIIYKTQNYFHIYKLIKQRKLSFFFGISKIFYILRSMQETYYAYAEVDPVSKNALAAISDLISRLHVRTLIANTQWGELSKSEIGRKIRDDFIGDFKDFCEFLSSK